MRWKEAIPPFFTTRTYYSHPPILSQPKGYLSASFLLYDLARFLHDVQVSDFILHVFLFIPPLSFPLTIFHCWLFPFDGASLSLFSHHAPHLTTFLISDLHILCFHLLPSRRPKIRAFFSKSVNKIPALPWTVGVLLCSVTVELVRQH